MKLIYLCALCALVALGCGDDDGATDGGTDSGGADSAVDSGDMDSGDTDGGGTDSGGVDGGGMDAGPPMCGDRRITAPEECDDGNTTPGDGCDDMCRIETSASCGDGNIDLPGEQCDDGNTTPGDGCDDRCLVEAPTGCGDGTLDIASGEECDDGNTAPGDGCSPSCQLEAVGAFCGDDMMDPGEVCDDGNTTNGDGCNPTCNLTGTSTLFAGQQGTPGIGDGVGASATIGGFGTLAVDSTYLWLAQGDMTQPKLRRIEIATADVVTVADIAGAEGIATNGTDTVWVAGGNPPEIQSISTTAPFTVNRVTGGPGTRCTMASCYMDGAPGTATFSEIRGLTFFGGFLWIVDPDAAVIRRLDPSSGDVVTVAGSPFQTSTTPVDGIGNVARFESPRYIVSNGSGLLYIADTNGAAIRVLNSTTNQVTTFAGNGTPAHVDGMGGAGGPARIHRPRGITADGSSVYWVEFNQHTIRQGVAATLDVSTLSGMPGSNGYMEGVGSAARWDGPFSIAYHFPTSSLFVVDGANNLIRRIQ